MANFVATLSKLTGFVDYLFWKICIKSTLTLITYSGALFTAEDMLNALVLSQTTDVDEVTRRNFMGFQVLAVLNSTLLNNFSIHD